MLRDILEKTYLQNSVQDYLIFLGAFLVGIVVVQLLKHIIEHRLKVWSEKTHTSLDDFLVRIIEKQVIPLLYFGSLYMASGMLTLNAATARYIDIAGVIILTYYGLQLLIVLINYSLETYWVKKEINPERQKNVKGIVKIVKVFIWGIGITFLLDNLGFKISTVVAGLGIGGIAVALAAQTILGDLFSYFVIFFDKPFEAGDFIIIDTYMGTIEHIGIKTTRVRSLGGEQLVFSNTDLTSARIRNYKRMEKRRVIFSLGVTYQTTSEQLKAIPGIIRQIVDDIGDTVFDRAHFATYGDFSLNFEIVYYVLSSDYNKYMDLQQEINFKIKDEFEQRGIDFAYPTQTLFMERNEEQI